MVSTGATVERRQLPNGARPERRKTRATQDPNDARPEGRKAQTATTQGPNRANRQPRAVWVLRRCRLGPA